MTAPIAKSSSTWTLARSNWIYGLIFLYFFTTSADLLHIEISLFRCKVNHALAFLLFFVFALEQKKWVLPDKKLLLSFLAIGVSIALSGIFGVYPYRSLMYVPVYFFTFLAYFLLPFNLLIAYGKEAIFKLYFAAFVATGIIGAIQFFLSFFGIIAPFVGQFVANTISRGQALTYEPSYFALFMVPYVMYHNARFLFDSEKVLDFPKLRSLFWKNLLLLVSTSTGAFFAYFVFLFIVVFTLRHSWLREYRNKIFNKLFKISALFALLFFCISLLIPQVFFSSFWKFFATGFAHLSFVDRFQGIIVAWDTFLAHPILGVGVGGVGPLICQKLFSQGRQIDFHEPYVQMFEPFDPTNVFSELLASLGCIGLIAFGSMFYLYFRYLHRTAKIPQLSQKEKSTIYGLLISIGVMLIVLQFNQNLFRSYIWVHLAISLGYMFSIRGKYAQRR